MKSASLPGVRLLWLQALFMSAAASIRAATMQAARSHATSQASCSRLIPFTAPHASALHIRPCRQKAGGNEAGTLTAAMPCEGRYGIKESPAATSSGHGCRTFLVRFQRHRPRYLAFSSYTRLLSFCALKSGRPTVMRYSPE